MTSGRGGRADPDLVCRTPRPGPAKGGKNTDANDDGVINGKVTRKARFGLMGDEFVHANGAPSSFASLLLGQQRRVVISLLVVASHTKLAVYTSQMHWRMC